MKFLIALSVLASSSVFASNLGHDYIKCYDSPQQTGELEVAYKFKYHGDDIRLVYPRTIDLGVVVTDVDGGPGWQCLMSEEAGVYFQACQGEGQHIRGLVPVDIGKEETVYCERSILDWVSGVPTDTKLE